MFADRSNAFIGLPGGYGTLEEVMEMTTWSQIGVHKKRELFPLTLKSQEQLDWILISHISSCRSPECQRVLLSSASIHRRVR